MKLTVNLKDYQYDIFIEKGLLNHIDTYIQNIYKGKKIVIISDDNVYKHYGYIQEQLSSLYEVYSVVVEPGEQSKSFDILPSLYKQLLSYKITRSDLIIALGGGVIGDLAGFISATYLRGISLIQVPTSLLAQVDSSVGGKVAVDLAEGKNLVGAFKHPMCVLIDPDTLKTLDQRYIYDGMGEVIKYACLFDKNLFNRLEYYKDFNDLYNDIEDVIYKCIDFKRKVVEEDVYDKGNRMLLNFGHTLGHAIEQYYHYQTYSHGEAVSIGMVQIMKIAEIHKLAKEGISDKISALCKKYNLPVSANIQCVNLIDAILLDKKNINSRLSYILLKDIGESYIYPSDYSFIKVVKEI